MAFLLGINETPLIISSRNGYTEIVKQLLLQYGIDVNSQDIALQFFMIFALKTF